MKLVLSLVVQGRGFGIVSDVTERPGGRAAGTG